MLTKRFVPKPKDSRSMVSDIGLPQCFEIDLGLELKDVPMTAEEYLLKVIRERENCEEVKTCDKNLAKLANKQSIFIKEVHVASNLKPTIEWQNIQVADFSDVRMYIHRMLAKKSQWPDCVKRIKIRKGDLEAWKRFFDENEPTLSCIFGLPYVLVDDALEILIEKLDNISPGETIDHKTGQWIYAFLACTRLPLLSYTVNMLRHLARKCVEIRSHINPEDENCEEAVAPLNIFICLVSRYFRQYDLAD